jgi:hypothetical protein
MTLSNDVEMLQTDVMRFFAILCLCLMAIFALVKALPMSPPADQPTLVEPLNLQTEAASLLKKIAALKEKLVKTQSQLSAATAALERSAAQAVDTAAREQKTRSRLSKARQELTMVSHSLKQARTEIKEREATLARIVNDIQEKRQIRSELRAQIENETQNFEKLQATLEKVTEKLNQPVKQTKQIPPEAPASKAATQSTRKGFTLRFASDKALETLITHKKVRFFALAGNKAWQLKLANNRPVYIAIKNPSKIYEMETATVPAHYAAVFSRQVAAFGRDRVTWGVTIPAPTAEAINRLIHEREGGDLIIMPDGEVILN